MKKSTIFNSKTCAFVLALSNVLIVTAATAALTPTQSTLAPSSTVQSKSPNLSRSKLPSQLAEVKERVLQVENSILASVKNKNEAADSVRKIQTLIKLQKQERELANARIQELESTVVTLEERRIGLKERIAMEKLSVKKGLRELKRIDDVLPESPDALLVEELEQPKRKVLKNIVNRGLHELEALHVDLQDAEQLETRIAEERNQLDSMINELAESESILELNKQLQVDLINRTHQERLSQLDQYKKLKSSERQVAKMMTEFNARMELQEVERSERSANQAMYVMSQSPFSKLKGSLGLPIEGTIVSKFGKARDQQTRLTVFKKGIEIRAATNSSVKAVFEGKVAYVGELPHYGKMMIVDHGDHFYTLVAQLGETSKKVGDSVKTGTELGMSDSAGNPVYFEIRARNIPVDPLQWVGNSSKI